MVYVVHELRYLGYGVWCMWYMVYSAYEYSVV
jgi:hypothetical protein